MVGAVQERERPAELQTLVEEYAGELAFDPAAVRTVSLDLQRLREAGVLLRVEVKGTSRMWRRPVWEELGVREGDIRAQLYTAGVNALFPRALIGPIESMERRFGQWLDRLSYDVAGFRPYRLLLKGEGSYANPARSAYWSFRVKFDELLAEWNERIAALVDDTPYAEARAQAADNYRRIAVEEAYPAILNRVRAAMARDGLAPLKRQEILDQLGDPTMFADRLVTRAMARFPSQQALRDGFKVTLIPALLLNPGQIEEALLAGERARVQADLVEAEQLNLYVARMLDEPSPYDGVLNEQPAQLFQVAIGAADTLERHGGSLPGQTKKALLRLKAQYLLMALARDARIERALDELEQALALEAGVENALNHLLRATAPGVQFMAELRPEVWGGLAERAFPYTL